MLQTLQFPDGKVSYMPAKGTEPVWCLIMFDLPTNTKNERKEATKFRNILMDLGFCRVQFSVYVQYFPLAARISSTVKHIKSNLPNGGDIRILCVTDTQWSKTICYSKKNEIEPEEIPTQLMIF